MHDTRQGLSGVSACRLLYAVQKPALRTYTICRCGSALWSVTRSPNGGYGFGLRRWSVRTCDDCEESAGSQSLETGGAARSSAVLHYCCRQGVGALVFHDAPAETLAVRPSPVSHIRRLRKARISDYSRHYASFCRRDCLPTDDGTFLVILTYRRSLLPVDSVKRLGRIDTSETVLLSSKSSL